MSELSPSLRFTPDLDSWIRIHRDGTVTVFTGKVELGQGLKSAIARIGAEEMDVSLERVRVQTADTACSPNEFFTVGSQSMEDSGTAVRQAAAEARRHLLELASERLGVPVDRLQVEDGTIKVPNSELHTTYWELAWREDLCAYRHRQCGAQAVRPVPHRRQSGNAHRSPGVGDGYGAFRTRSPTAGHAARARRAAAEPERTAGGLR